jgi:hypothetical protein
LSDLVLKARFSESFFKNEWLYNTSSFTKFIIYISVKAVKSISVAPEHFENDEGKIKQTKKLSGTLTM